MLFFQSVSDVLSSMPLPLSSSKVQAGFPSPADDHMDNDLDLNSHLITSPSSTFFVRVIGDSMLGAGIKDGSLLVVDKSKMPVHNKIVIAIIDGEFTVKRLIMTNEGFVLMPENSNFKPIRLGNNSTIWGVVTAIINQV